MATKERLNELRVELIKRRMERTRAALAGKIQTLGARLHGAAETVASFEETVESAVGTVKETVQSTVETVQNVREQLDVRKHPLLMLGGSVLAGYMAGVLIHRRSTPATNGTAVAFVPAPAPAPPAAPVTPSPGRLAALLEQGKRLGLGAVLGLVRDLIAREVPPEARPTVMDYANEFITTLGGEPPGPLLAEPEEGGAHDGRHEAEVGRPLGPVEREGQGAVGPTYRR